MKSLHKLILMIIMLISLPIAAWSLEYPFKDTMDTMDNWLSNKNWGLSSIYHSAYKSITDSPQGGYQNSETDNALVMAESFALPSNVQFPTLLFWHKYEIESEFDYGFLDISKDNGENWENLEEYTGISDWTREQLDLSDYVGYTQLKFRFSLESDKTIVGDGWYIDDVTIDEAPNPVLDFNATPSTTQANAIELTWIQSYESNFAYYQIHRSLSPGVKILNEKVTTINSQSQTSYRDINLNPNETYYYKIYVFNTLNMTTGSKEILATTFAANPITLTIVSSNQNNAHLSWNACENDKFDRYEIRRHTTTVNKNHTLIKTITDPSQTSLLDQYSAIQPIQYHYKIWVYFKDVDYTIESNETIAAYEMAQADYPFYDNDILTTQWTPSGTWGFTSQNPYAGLSAWTDSPNGNYPNNADMTLTTFIDMTKAIHPVLTFWHRYIFASGDSITLEYSTNNGAIWSPLQSKGKINYKWQGVENHWNMERIDLSDYSSMAQFGLRFRLKSDDSANEEGWFMDNLTIQEGANLADFPFLSDDDIAPFFYDSTWSLSDKYQHSGQLSWADSPFASYANDNMDASLYLTIDLQNSLMPMLSFWHLYSLQQDVDFGDILVQELGSDKWDNIYFVTGNTTEWKYDTLDLSEYAGKIVVIRFRTKTDASTTHEGWFIDQIQVHENTTRHSYPFHDDMESEQTKENWISSSWELVNGVGEKYEGQYAWTDSPEGNYRYNDKSSIVLSGTIDLSEAVNPQLTFWHKYNIYASGDCNGSYGGAPDEYDYFYIQISDYYGHPGTWKDLEKKYGSSATWEKKTFDLSNYSKSSSVKIRFKIVDETTCHHEYDGWYIDKLSIKEASENLALTITSNNQCEVILSWNADTVETNFSHYEIYRHTASITTRNTSYLKKTIYDKNITSWTDQVDQLKNYYYKIWIIDQGNAVNLSSNEVKTSFPIPTHSLPFYENAEEGQVKFSAMKPFALTDDNPHSGTYAWTDSPEGNYAPNTTKTMTTFVDLTQIYNPVLSFWHKYELQEDLDFIRIYTSINNGDSWQELKKYTGVQPFWRQERLNLSNKAGKVVGIQFRLSSNASIEMDGWYMDDLMIQDEPVETTYPFSDDVESDSLRWFYDPSWQRTSEKSHSGNFSWTDSPNGSYKRNSNTTLEITADLTSAVIPVLSFWHAHYLADNDVGYVELSNNKRVFQTYGDSGQWHQEYISLSDYVGQKILIRFRFDDNNDTLQSDGWYIDDIAISEAANTAFSYPFLDTMDTTDQWLPSSWFLEREEANFFITTQTSTAITNELIMSHTIDLSQSKHPQLSFMHKYDSGKVFISTNNGLPNTWTLLSTFSNQYTMWQHEEVDISSYAGFEKVRFKFSPLCYDTSKCWQIDDIRIGENTNIPVIIAKISGDHQKGEVEHALDDPFVVHVHDSEFSPKTGIPIIFQIVTNNAGSLDYTRVISDSEGKASVNYTNGSLAGEAEILAYVEDQPDEKVSFSAFATLAQYAYEIRLQSGNFQTAEINTLLDNPLVVKILDIRGDPVKDATVTFTLKMGSASILSTEASTYTDGLAKTNIQMGNIPGKTQISAIGENLVGSPIVFTLYNVMPGGYLGDMDGDAMPDEWELKYGYNPQDPSDAELDDDSDLLTNALEYFYATEPKLADSDYDLMPDGWEVKYRLNPNDPTDDLKDNDGDGVSNVDEYLGGSPPIGPPHFTLAGITSNWMDIYGRVHIDGSPAESGDEIAVIDQDGIVCGHYILETAGQYGFMHVYKDDSNTPLIDEGVLQGEILNFRIWDASLQTEINATPHVITGTQPPTWTNDGDIANIDLNGAGIKTIPLHEGWNLFSFPIKRCFYIDNVAGYEDGVPDIPLLSQTIVEKVNSIADVLTSIHGKYEVVRSFDQKGAHTYDPELPEFSDMKYIAGGYGYWIKMKSSANLEINGVRTSATDRLSLHKGWNLIGYWYRDVQYVKGRPEVNFPPDITSFIKIDTIKNIFFSIDNTYDMIRSFDYKGAHTFDPMLDGFNFNDLYYAGQGYGFWIRMKEHGELHYQ